MTLIVDDAEPRDPVTLEQATNLARRTLESQFRRGAELTASEPFRLDGEPARRFRAQGEGRLVELAIALHAGKTWTLTLNGRPGAFDPTALDGAIASWRWDR